MIILNGFRMENGKEIRYICHCYNEMGKYEANGDVIVFKHRSGEIEERAICCDAPHAVGLLNVAIKLNAERNYTASARANRAAEMCKGFEWFA